MKLTICDRCKGIEGVEPIRLCDELESITLEIKGDLCKKCRFKIENYFKRFMLNTLYKDLGIYIKDEEDED